MLLPSKPEIIKAGRSRDEPKLLSLLKCQLSCPSEAPELLVLLLQDAGGCSEGRRVTVCSMGAPPRQCPRQGSCAHNPLVAHHLTCLPSENSGPKVLS